jgi:hypothetical protein
METFVRQHADTDTTDAPSANLEVYARAAYNDIRRRVATWLDNFTSDTLTVTAGTDSYTLSGGGFSGANDIEYVTEIVGSTDKLTAVSFDVFTALKDGSTVSYQTKEADVYAMQGGTIYLWPEPSTSGETYTVYGYREFASWPSGSDEPDLPREFDEAICWYMLSKYYMAQEDVELAQYYMADYERIIGVFIASAMKNGSHRPRIFGGGAYSRTISYGDWLRRNTEGV